MASATLTTTSSAASAAATPAAPAHLPAAAKQQWSSTYAKALAQAKLDFPENDRAQRSAALKKANAMLAVPPPTSAAEIDALEPWQVLKRGTRVEKVDGVDVPVRVCITADGRKYAFPIAAPAAADAPTDKPAGKSGTAKTS